MKLTQIEQVIYDYLKMHDSLSAREILEIVGNKYATNELREASISLINRGLVEYNQGNLSIKK